VTLVVEQDPGPAIHQLAEALRVTVYVR